MDDLIEKVKKNQGKIRELQKEATRKQGEKEQLIKQLQSDFEVNNLEEAQSLLENLEEMKAENERAIEKNNAKMEEIISSARTRTTS